MDWITYQQQLELLTPAPPPRSIKRWTNNKIDQACNGIRLLLKWPFIIIEKVLIAMFTPLLILMSIFADMVADSMKESRDNDG